MTHHHIGYKSLRKKKILTKNTFFAFIYPKNQTIFKINLANANKNLLPRENLDVFHE